MKKVLLVSLAAVAVGLVVAAVIRRRDAVAASPTAQILADRVAAGADRVASVSRDISDRVQDGAVRTADTVESAARSVVDRVDEVAAATASAAETADNVVADAADHVATAAVESTTVDPTSSQ